MRFHLIIAFLLLGSTAQSQEFIFSVDDHRVTKEEFSRIYLKNNPDTSYTREDIEEYIQLYLNFKLKVQEAKDAEYDTSRAFQQEYNSYEDQLAKPYLTRDKMVDSLTRQGYQRSKEIIKARHILVRSPKNSTDTTQAYNKILNVYSKAISGEDFEELAKAYSEEPNASNSGGNLGYFSAFQMVYPFENVAYQTEVDSISTPFKTDFGYHILKVEDRQSNPGKRQVSHIMLRFKPGMSKSDSITIENQMNMIYESLLENSTSWDSLCSIYSEDQNSRIRNGKLKEFGVGEILPSFGEVAFALKDDGEISKPFTTPFGWHVIRLDKKTEIEDYNSSKAEIRRKVLKDSRVKIGDNNSFEVLRSKYQVKIDSSSYNQIIKVDNLNELSNSEFPNSVLLQSSNRSFYTDDFISYVQAKYNKTDLKIDTEKEFESYLNKILLDLEKEGLKNSNEEFRFILKEYYEGMLLFSIMEDSVWNVANSDTVGLKAYFDSNIDHFTTYDSLKLVIFEVESKSNLDKQSKRLLKDINKNNQKGEWYTFEGWKKHSVDQVFYNEELGKYGIATEAKGKKNVDLEDIKGMVISSYQNYLEAQWVERLKKKHSVNINNKEVESTIAEIIEK